MLNSQKKSHDTVANVGHLSATWDILQYSRKPRQRY